MYHSDISLAPAASNSNIHGNIHGMAVIPGYNTGGVEYLLFMKFYSTASRVVTPFPDLPRMQPGILDFKASGLKTINNSIMFSILIINMITSCV